MFSPSVSAGDVILATDANSRRKDAGLFSGDDVDITYDNRDRIATIVHNDFAVTLTITYNARDQISSVTDGTNTWNFAYDSFYRLTGITKA